MKASIITLLVAAFATFAWLSLPAPRPETAPQPGGHATGHGGDPGAFADGVVVSVDEAASNVTISHGPLYNLGMPSMTMGFRVGEPALLTRMKPGERIRFRADVVHGALTVTGLEAISP